MKVACEYGAMTMIIRLLITVLLSVSLLGGTTGVVSAAAAAPSPQDEALLALINQARQNPLAVAASMGMDPEKILQDLPELEKILREGLPPVTFNGNLFNAARAHTQDMFANGYYSHVSPDGRGYDERIRDAGYPAVATGESLGMLTFANFIDPNDAARFIFEYMFWDELDPARTEKRNILDPDLKEAGISVDAGVLSLGGVLWNVYLATCDFGAVISGPEAELLQLINQARANPLKTAALLGMDTERLLTDLPLLSDVLTKGLPPLAFDSRLYRAARDHGLDMLDKVYYSHASPDGRTYEDRIREAGYEAALAGEVIGSLAVYDSLAEKDAVFQIFAAKFKEELDPVSATERVILNGAFKDGGVYFKVFEFPVEGGGLGTYGLIVADLGRSTRPAKPSLTGVVYTDANGDGQYGFGEGVPNTFVTVKGNSGALSVFTNLAGGFALELDPGQYTVTVDPEGSILERVVDLGEENLGLWFQR